MGDRAVESSLCREQMVLGLQACGFSYTKFPSMRSDILFLLS